MLVGDAVELEHRHAGLEMLGDELERLLDELAGARHALDLLRDLRMIMRLAGLHLLERLGDLGPDVVDRALCVHLTSLPWRGSASTSGSVSRVVDREPPLDPSGVSSARPSSAARFSSRSRQTCRRSSSSSEDESTAAADLAQQVVERLRLDERAREAVEHEARQLSPRSSRSRISRIVISSATRSPSVEIGATCRPSSVPAAIARGTCRPSRCAGRRTSTAIFFACVPFPDPCGPEDEDVQRRNPS